MRVREEATPLSGDEAAGAEGRGRQGRPVLDVGGDCPMTCPTGCSRSRLSADRRARSLRPRSSSSPTPTSRREAKTRSRGGGSFRGRQRREKRRIAAPDGLFATRAGGDDHGGRADRVFERAHVALRGGGELLVAGDAGGRGLPARKLLVLGLEPRDVLGERRQVGDRLSVQAVAEADGNLLELVEAVQLRERERRPRRRARPPCGRRRRRTSPCAWAARWTCRTRSRACGGTRRSRLSAPSGRGPRRRASCRP